jgi:hypothetical protein
MAKKPTAKQQTPGVDEVAVLSSLSQQGAAWLAEKSPAWLRDHSHRFVRDAAGRYDARQVCRALRSEPAAATLDDREHEAALQLAARLAFDPELPRAVAALREIQSRHGAAGLLSVAELLLEQLESLAAEVPMPSATEIESAHQARLADRLSQLQPPVFVCEDCRSWRQGRTWHKGDCPGGHRVVLDQCETCSVA